MLSVDKSLATISARQMDARLSILPALSYTGIESMNRQADCKPTAYLLFDEILTQLKKKFD